MKSLCPKCTGETNQKVLFEEKQVYHEESGWYEKRIYQIIKCEGCDTISFRELYSDAGDEQFDDYTGEDPWTQTLYPRRTKHTLAIKQLLNTPPNLKLIYRETIDAFNNNQTILCSAGLRAIIEGICNEKGITSGEVNDGKGGTRTSKNLDGKIEGLSAKGFLTKGNAEILHDLRFLGNEALHALSSPSSEELKIAINIIEHTIENIYELQHKAKQLKEKIEKRKK